MKACQRFLFFLFALHGSLSSQTRPGIAIYPTGTETGLGFRSSKESRFVLDARISKASFYSDHSKNSSFGSEISCVYRLVKYEKVRFHIGLGYKADWNFPNDHRHGVVIPIGVEAFPFPFQNAGLFFEAAPFALLDRVLNCIAGIRTAAGFVFYFVRTPKTTSNEKP